MCEWGVCVGVRWLERVWVCKWCVCGGEMIGMCLVPIVTSPVSCASAHTTAPLAITKFLRKKIRR